MDERPVGVGGRSISASEHFGHCAWTILHAACYAVESLSVEKGDAHESPIRFARNYVVFVRSLLAVYPCSACRRHARVALPAAVQSLEACVRALPDDVTAEDVADILAIEVFKMHNAVRRGQDARGETGDGPRQRADFAEALNQMEIGLENGSVRREDVAQYLRSLWK